MTGSIVQINVSPGGLPKAPIERAIVDELGIQGDDHRDKKHRRIYDQRVKALDSGSPYWGISGFYRIYFKDRRASNRRYN
jgi:hypothetical protein